MHRQLVRGLALLMIAAVLAACSSTPSAPSEVANAEYTTESSVAAGNDAAPSELVLRSGSELTTAAPANEADAACFFTDANYTTAGLCVTKAAVAGDPVQASEYADLRAVQTENGILNFNDVFSSVQVAPGYRVEMFYDIGFGGGAWIARGDVSNFVPLVDPAGVSFNDKMSGFKVFRE